MQLFEKSKQPTGLDQSQRRPLFSGYVVYLVNSALFVAGAKAMAFVAVFVFTAVLARKMDPESFGHFILFLTGSTFCSVISSFGFNRSLVKRIAKDPAASSIPRFIRFSLLFTTLVALGVGLLFGMSVDWISSQSSIGIHQNASLILCVIACVVFRAVHLVLGESCRGFHERICSNLFGGISGAAVAHMTFALGLLVCNDFSLQNIVLLYAVCNGVWIPVLGWKLIQLVTNAKHIQINEQGTNSAPDQQGDIVAESNEHVCWPLVCESTPIMLGQILGLCLVFSDLWIAGLICAPGMVACYAAAQRMLAFLTLAPQVTNTSITSLIPKLHSQNRLRELQSILTTTSWISALPGILLGTALLIFAEDVLTFTFGAYYGLSADLLRILVMGQFFCMVTGPSELVLIMTGQQKKSVAINMLTVLLIASAAPFALIGFGLVGLAMVIAFVTASQNLLTCYVAHRCVGIRTDIFTLHSITPLLSFSCFQEKGHSQ